MNVLFTRLRALIVKELQALLRDPQSRSLLFVPVILQLAIFPYSATLEVRNNTLAILNNDGGIASAELMQRFGRAQAFDRTLILQSQGAFVSAIENQKALIGVQFPADFSRSLQAGKSGSLQVILDGRRSNSGQIAFSYLQSIVEEYNREQHLQRGIVLPSQIMVRHWYNPNLNYQWFIIPSLIAIITTLSTMIVTSLSIAREKEHGTFDQLLVSPLTPSMIMFGKALPAFFVAIFQATIILLGGLIIYGVPFEGSILLLYGSMLVYICSIVGFGLLISSVCATQQQAFLGVFTFMVPAILLSGFVAPIENMPIWLQKMNWLNPLSHYIKVVKGIMLKDITAEVTITYLWPLAVIASITLTAANWKFRHRLN